ncbi:MAG: carboxymuconolactone decarboxylase family protein [Alicyclobacillaceae bacterium]|nr:carboxymuconolactone decarboxylase family protein [Alicyclobacillaceae bacterium]
MYQKGIESFRKLFGEDQLAQVLAATNPFDESFYRMLMTYCFGEIWGNEGLTWKQRSLNNLCILAALNRPREFEIHFRGALRNGCTLDELRETLLQIAVYAGIPAGVEAFRIARKVLDEEGVRV